MSREVSVEEQIAWQARRYSSNAAIDYAFPDGITDAVSRATAHEAAILATLRRSVLLERVAEAGNGLEKIGIELVPLLALEKRVGVELLNRLAAALDRLAAALDKLAALRDHDKLGKDSG